MPLRVFGALLVLMVACASPRPVDQLTIPIAPLVAPKPIVVPAPVAPVLPPPVPWIVVPHDVEPQPEEAAKPEPAPEKQPPPKSRPPPPPVEQEKRPECRVTLVPHKGGDTIHNTC